MTRALLRPAALLASLLAMFGAAPAAKAAVTCTLKNFTVTGDSSAPDYYNTPLNGTVATRIYSMQMEMKNTTSTQERIAMGTNWISGGGSYWVSAANAVKYRTENGLALALRAESTSGPYVSSTANALASQQTLAGNATVNVVWSFVVELKRVGTVVPGAFGSLGSPYAFGGMFYNRSTSQWEYVQNSGCSLGAPANGFPSATGTAAPTPPAVNTVVCTINGGAPVNVTLPQVQVANMAAVGTLPTHYPKQRVSLRYGCSGTGGQTNPAYTIALAGTKGGTTTALASDKANVGVMVEAITSRGEGPTTMVPGSTTDYAGATRVPLRDAGQTGGSVMTLISYPVRTGTGTIQPGSFKASGTLKVFTL